jgi:hypothetical protein
VFLCAREDGGTSTQSAVGRPQEGSWGSGLRVAGDRGTRGGKKHPRKSLNTTEIVRLCRAGVSAPLSGPHDARQTRMHTPRGTSFLPTWRGLGHHICRARAQSQQRRQAKGNIRGLIRVSGQQEVLDRIRGGSSGHIPQSTGSAAPGISDYTRRGVTSILPTGQER